jgi:hypothetical protein
MKQARPTPRRTAALAVAAIQAWLLVLWAGAGLHVDDVSYLSGLDTILAGLEAPRPMRHLSWGLLHAVGHLPFDGSGWLAGTPGRLLQGFGSLVVAWTAWVAWRLARALELDERGAAIAAVLAALTPAVAVVAGMPGVAPRWLGVGTGLLALGLGVEALRGLAGLASGPPVDGPGEARILAAILLRRRLLGAALLFGLALAWHPSAVGLLPAAGLLWWEAARAPDAPPVGRRRVRALAGGLWAVWLLLALAWVRMSGQEGMAEMGASRLASALWAKPAVGLAQLGWELPGLGRLLPSLHPGVSVVVGAGLVIGLLAWRPGRRLGLLALGLCLALVPEAANLGYTAELASAWTVNHVEASMGLAVAASLAVAVLVARLPGRVLLAAVVLLALLAGVRGTLVVDARRADAVRDAELQRRVGHELIAGMATSGRRLAILGDPRQLQAPMKALKWIPEAPPARRRLRSGVGAPGQVAAYGLQTQGMGAPRGLDPAFWTMASIRCELRLGLPRDARGRCAVLDLLEQPRDDACLLDLRGPKPEVRCAAPTLAFGAAGTRDPRCWGWALLALLVLGVTGLLSREPRGQNPPEV